ncbi:transglycosylase SLT domain-containing protein [Mesorhizobium sp. WSM3882]|uniref:transglycosylase SLT domain-containing protein n=1 Tax=Mesorhizobium sp. WSM3882 TaxID=2029407 RepID=UPI000BAF3C55|nr:transglycosylase SLT domain-containing protein [Mesorhizobium sp. WSM3882]PBB30301.1 hypothetical protein CK214_20250 [Mesorhizobium sp. WSM3882]
MTKSLKKYLKLLVLTTTILLSACGTAQAVESPSDDLRATLGDGSIATKPASVEVKAKPRGGERAEIKALIGEVAVRHGIEPKDFLRMAQIESGFNPRAYHPKSRAAGLFQFIPSTARRYGLKDPFDAQANAEAAAALWLENAAGLRKALGREPTAGEIYLAHQQGLGGAIGLLKDPDRQAAVIVGNRAVIVNGGRLGMTARDFAQLWIGKFA